MSIQIENLQEKYAITDNISGLLNRVVDLSFVLENFNFPADVSFLLTDDDGIKEINNEHRKINKPTDVLSFPIVEMFNGEIISKDGDFDLDEEALVLGDIVISLERVNSQAKEYGHSFERELAFLATHGLFHLLGYDHEDSDAEKNMIGRQEAVLDQMGLGKTATT